MAENKIPTLCLSYEKFCLALFHEQVGLWTKNISIFPKTTSTSRKKSEEQIKIEVKV